MKKLNPQQIIVKWDNVLVRQDELMEQTASGLIVANIGRKEENAVCRGTIIQVGPGAVDPFGVFREMEFQVGDEILYPQHWTRSFVIGAEHYDIIPQTKIHGVIE